MSTTMTAPAASIAKPKTPVEEADEKYEHYLLVLEQYQAARAELSAALSSGYFSLAQANFTSQNRIRHGQDFYDDRMKASRLVEMSQEDSISIKETGSENETKDPIQWYGVFVPPALRKAQTHFTTAVAEAVPRVINLERSLKAIEAEIKSLKL